MIVAVPLAALILGAAVVIAVAYRTLNVDRLITNRVRRQVIVEMRSGETFRGLMSEADVNVLILVNAQAIPSQGAAGVDIDGELILPRPDVKWLQRP